MEINEEIKKINERIIKLWEKYPEKSGKHSPLLYPLLKKGKILFIGMNPSLTITSFNRVKRDGGFKDTEFPDFFKKENLQKNKDKLIEFEKLAKEKCSFFDKFREIDKDFEHIDLFLYRLTQQADFKKEIGLDKNKNGEIIKTPNFGDFGKEQLNLASDLIQLIKPKLVVVANAFASDIINDNKYKEIFKVSNNQELFDKKGYDTIKINGLDVPIIFTSMLTKQRALDNHTFRRLKWQIKKITESLK